MSGGFWICAFDVTDETTISHFFALRYHTFFLEEDGVSAVDLVADTLCKSPDLFGEGFSPNLFSVSLYEVAVLLGLTDDGVSHGVCLRDCDIICRVGVLC